MILVHEGAIRLVWFWGGVLPDRLAGFSRDSTELFSVTPLVLLRRSQDRNWDTLQMCSVEFVLFYFLGELYCHSPSSLLREL